jgi:hypothetical protein
VNAAVHVGARSGSTAFFCLEDLVPHFTRTLIAAIRAGPRGAKRKALSGVAAVR